MPSEIRGSVTTPPSKSMMVRAAALTVLAEGTTKIFNPSFCDDGLVALGVVETLGAQLEKGKGEISVHSKGIFRNVPKSSVLECGESGLCMRTFAPIVALSGKEFTLNAKGTLLKRPMEMLGELLQLGASVATSDGFAPVRVKGPIHGDNMKIDGSKTSQFLTGLLMALPLCKEDSVIEVSDLKSKQYVEMTIALVKDFGVGIDNENFRIFRISGAQKYAPSRHCTLEGDWSGAAFMLVAGAIAGKVKVNGLRLDSPQADKAIIDALEKAGAKITTGASSISIEKNELNAFEFDATGCPDLFPPLVALAANCNGTSFFTGTKRLRAKESDRAAALRSEFAKMGIRIVVKGDVMHVKGGKIRRAEVEPHGDHRIAMACAIAALNADGEVRIKNPGCVFKSYPDFFDDLEKLMKVEK